MTLAFCVLVTLRKAPAILCVTIAALLMYPPMVFSAVALHAAAALRDRADAEAASAARASSSLTDARLVDEAERRRTRELEERLRLADQSVDLLRNAIARRDNLLAEQRYGQRSHVERRNEANCGTKLKRQASERKHEQNRRRQQQQRGEGGAGVRHREHLWQAGCCARWCVLAFCILMQQHA